MINTVRKFLKKNIALSMDELIYDHETFEEIPLVARLDHVKILQDCVLREDLNTFLFNIALFYLRNAELYARKHLDKQQAGDFSIFITYTDEDDYALEKGYYNPSLFVTRKKGLIILNEENKITDFSKFPFIAQTIDSLNIADQMTIYYKKWFDESCQIYLQRFYLFLKNKFLFHPVFSIWVEKKIKNSTKRT